MANIAEGLEATRSALEAAQKKEEKSCDPGSETHLANIETWVKDANADLSLAAFVVCLASARYVSPAFFCDCRFALI